MAGERGAPRGLGECFGDGEPLVVSVRKRGRRYDIDDRGAAVAKMGRPRGWLEVAKRVVREDGLNVNRAGVVFVPVVEGRDLAALALRIARASLPVNGALFELGDD